MSANLLHTLKDTDFFGHKKYICNQTICIFQSWQKKSVKFSHECNLVSIYVNVICIRKQTLLHNLIANNKSENLTKIIVLKSYVHKLHQQKPLNSIMYVFDYAILHPQYFTVENYKFTVWGGQSWIFETKKKWKKFERMGRRHFSTTPCWKGANVHCWYTHHFFVLSLRENAKKIFSFSLVLLPRSQGLYSS